MGESLDFLTSGHDEALMAYITSVNIACGYHAGDEYIMEKTIENAIKNNLKIGAHPGFDDKPNFGRKEVNLSKNEVKKLVTDQIRLLSTILNAKGIKMNHVKPHGALYNMSAKNKVYAEAIAEAVFEFDPNLILFGLAGSLSVKEAKKNGLKTFDECFADRAYLSDSSLANRNLPNAIKENIEAVKKQTHSLVNGFVFSTIDDSNLNLPCDTICIHSDTPNALEFAKAIYEIVVISSVGH